MGIGFVVIVPASEVEKTILTLEKSGEPVYKIGHIHTRLEESVRLID